MIPYKNDGVKREKTVSFASRCSREPFGFGYRRLRPFAWIKGYNRCTKFFRRRKRQMRSIL